MKNFVILIVVFAFLYGNAVARDQYGRHTIFNHGVKLCGRMTEEVKATVDGKNTYIGYIDGYLSGFNLLTPGKANFFEGTDVISRYKFVLKYCEENPLDMVATAIHKLILRYKSPLY